jgi:hypothetical protein
MKTLTLKQLAAIIAIKNTQAAIAGRPCPVAARVLARIEARLGG